jgi:uncharacterized protein YqgV (UPF0045/DUF77 family)
MHQDRTIIEGDIDTVMRVIVDCHKRIMTMSDRVVTNIKIDDRKGTHPMGSKVDSVREKIRSGCPPISDEDEDC